MGIRMHIPVNQAAYKWLYLILHIIVLGLSIFLIAKISYDTFTNVDFFGQRSFRKIDFWICIAFLLDFFIELVLAPDKWRYVLNRFIFLLVSIPYVPILDVTGVHLSAQAEYLIRFIPLVRGGYAMAIVVGWFTYNRAAGLFVTYLITLVATIYFASLVFYLYEHKVNTLVNDYNDAIWWAMMDVTTVGSDIVAKTPIGRILSVLLAALGMMMFPIFTVYITSLISQRRKDATAQLNLLGLDIDRDKDNNGDKNDNK